MKSGWEEGPQLKSPWLRHYFKLETSQSAKTTPEGANIIKYSYECCEQSILFYRTGVHWISHCQYNPAIWGVISNTLPRVGMNWKIHPLGPPDLPHQGFCSVYLQYSKKNTANIWTEQYFTFSCSDLGKRSNNQNEKMVFSIRRRPP